MFAENQRYNSVPYVQIYEYRPHSLYRGNRRTGCQWLFQSWWVAEIKIMLHDVKFFDINCPFWKIENYFKIFVFTVYQWYFLIIFIHNSFSVTEALDDDGLPHTLEHLIFLGSEDYPYKGLLDLWANRCLASGTNARTCRDHTYYTMTTAGSQGFLSLMPIYLEHILYPTLKVKILITFNYF